MVNNRKLAFMASLDFSSWEPKRVLESLSNLGYDGVGWTLAHFNPKSRSRRELKELVNLTKSYNLAISEIVVQQDVVSLDEKLRKDRIDLVKECIVAAGEVGIEVVNLFSGPAPWDPNAPRIPDDISEGKAWEQVLEAYDEFVNLAEKYKVYLAVEAVFGHLCHDYYTTRELINSFNSEYLGINMDPSHYVLYGNDISWVVKRWGEKIKHVHLKDVIGTPGVNGKDFMFPLLGEGMIDWKVFLKALDEIGYNGFLSVEFESFKYYRSVLKNDPAKAAEISMEQIKELTKL
ncbi:MAG: TIM barrel protein [Clostridia bacterium]|jgi:sugar phosphate isomerase/epimerase|nr:TIM barrel protein [Clostridia bacterium]